MLWGENRGKWKGRQPPGIEPRTPGLYSQCSATELRQPDNHRPSQSSIRTAQGIQGTGQGTLFTFLYFHLITSLYSNVRQEFFLSIPWWVELSPAGFSQVSLSPWWRSSRVSPSPAVAPSSHTVPHSASQQRKCPTPEGETTMTRLNLQVLLLLSARAHKNRQLELRARNSNRSPQSGQNYWTVLK